MNYQLIPKQTFLDQLLTINKADVHKVLTKANELTRAPQPDSKNKVRLKYDKDIYRLRVSEYRVIYSFGNDPAGRGYVSLLWVDTKSEDTYDDGPRASGPGLDLGALIDREPDQGQSAAGPPQRISWGAKRRDASDELPVKLTAELLGKWNVPDDHHAALVVCKTVDDLIAANVPEQLRERIFNLVSEPDWERVMRQPDLVVESEEDLIRFADGDLIAFLLKLDPEQEAFVRRAVDGKGPMLVKGGPGTGKSTVALYRVREMIASLRRAGIAQPRILFTTYTNALTTASRQQLERLLGEDARLVEVRTADTVALDVAKGAGLKFSILDHDKAEKLVERAVAEARLQGAPIAIQAQRRALERLGTTYLLQELQQVIEGRGIDDLETYLATSRSGRGVPLNAQQREAVWRVHEAFQRLVRRNGQVTWSGMRRLAADAAVAQPGMYDAVLVDEAQDLDPVLLRMLVECCRNPDRIFVTADANQSIYGSGFRWTDVHAGLRFRGRTGLLKTNHRSTPQIDRAARSYLELGSAAIDEPDEPVDGVRPPASGMPMTYSRADGPPPIVRSVADGHPLSVLLSRFVREATRGYRMGLGSCAVLVPTEIRGRQIAAWLNDSGIHAEFMASKELDLLRPSVKVITLKSAKGLEFPFVALAGFQPDFYPGLPSSGPDAGELEEALGRERRTIFVGMTRAMLALLVAMPPNPRPPINMLYRGFAPDLWDWERRTAPAGGSA